MRLGTAISAMGDSRDNILPVSPRLLEIKNREFEIRSELASIAAEKDDLLRTRPLSIGIVGFGKFGQFLAQRFKRQGHHVSALSRASESPEALALGVTYFGGLGSGADREDGSGAWKFLAQPDLEVVIIAVSILSFEQTVKGLPLHLLAAKPYGPRPRVGDAVVVEEGEIQPACGGALLADVLSVKVHPRAVLTQLAPRTVDVVCAHPMFGPESGSGSWKGLPFVFEKVAGRYENKDRVERFLSVFESEGCEMVEMGAKEHDLNSANSQFATHLVGRLLEQLRLEKTPIDTLAFRRMLALKDTVANDSFDLFYGLYKYNPNSIDTLLLLRRALVDLEWRLKEMDAGDMGTVGWKMKTTTEGRTSSGSTQLLIEEDDGVP
eukprot:CAMPEP_0171936472 /NCGR_PEP_ID=MMETSP0993-20121228/33864_1 /TAXON_ID=483369 /ORGANISM="non described non described, Strain CCMP2098" /LENGTH=378 /DNA_ID=CAMNT_0012577661 /DNA_START=184 /DNA_END=1320 /DNA_ORIENTATION=+